MNNDALGYYRILELSPQAGFEQIKQGYRDLAKFWHPDHNKDDNALENFQKLSVAYDTLKEEETRLRYDLLSMVYGAKDYPDYENIVPFADADKDANVRAFILQKVRGLIIKEHYTQERKILSVGNAPKILFQAALGNWLLGWWSVKAFYKNMLALRHNYKKAFSADESFKVLVHNVIAYQKEGDMSKACASAICALEFADEYEKLYLEKFIALANIRVGHPQKWNLRLLKLSQLVFPLVLILGVSLWLSVASLTNKPWQNWWGDSKEISYYQEVNVGNKNRTVDDVVVGKIHSIPVDKSDLSRLYHLAQATKIMYGPSDEFDVLKTLKASTTVRLTGYSPDNVWARVLIDNGEMGFVRMNLLAKGVGKEVPFGSSVYEK